MLQQRFIDEKCGGVWTFDFRRPDAGVWPGKIEGLLVEGHLYSHINDDGSKDAKLETEFSQLESAAAPVFEKIVARARVWGKPELSADEREIWDIFLYEQFRRVPDFYGSLLSPEQHRVQVEKFLDEFHVRIRPLTNKERGDLLHPNRLQRSYKNLRVSSLRAGGSNVLEIIGKRGLAVVHIPNAKKSFVLGSRPVAKWTHPDTNDLADDRVELWLPIAPDVMVGLGPTAQREVIVDISDANVRRINEGIAAQSSQIIGRSKKLIASLKQLVGRTVGKSSVSEEEWDEPWLDGLI